MMVFSFIFIPGFKVKASNTYTLDDFNDYTTLITEENIQAYFDYHNIDRSIYDAYFIVLDPDYYNGKPNYNKGSGTNYYNVGFYIFNYQDMLDGKIYILTNANDGYLSYRFVANKGRNYNVYDNTEYLKDFNKKFPNMNTYSYSPNVFLMSTLVGGIDSTTLVEPTVIYSNVDLLYADGSIAFPSSKPKSYTFNEDIDVTNISKVKVKFDLPSDTKNLNLSLNYSITGMNIFGTIGQPYVALKSINEDGKEQTDISNTDRVDYDTLVSNACVIADCEQYKDWKTNPFEEMLDGITEDKVNNFLNSHVTDISKWDSFREITNKIINSQYNYANHYVDDYNMTLLPDSTVNGYSLEFDTFNYNGSLHLNFTSNLNYTIEYEYMSDNEDYFTTINMKDYAALIMIPKVYDRDTEIQSSISSDIYLSGKYDIEFWESIESKNVLYRKSNYDDIVFSHYQHRLYPNAILYFIKKPVDNPNMDLYIKFDSRYYSYVTKTNLAEEVVINNPNTGEDVTIGDISDLYNYGLDNKSKFTFNSFLKPIKFVFESITNFYQNYCPELVQNFFYLIFVFFVVLVLIRIFL